MLRLPGVEKNYNSTRALRDVRVSTWHMCLDNQTRSLELTSIQSRPADVHDITASLFGDTNLGLDAFI
ncbi:MAG: hypothetical protein M0038_13685 [Pseudomonadota bacterium]|jgi:hypothetical protein|nr:hypothetical protein [Pseudomonadota bacterium]